MKLIMIKRTLFPSRPCSCFVFSQHYPVSYGFDRGVLRCNSALWDQQGWSYHWGVIYLHQSMIFTGDWQSHVGVENF